MQYITKIKTVKVPVPVPMVKYEEKTVYVPVYDDPFWNPAADGRYVCICVYVCVRMCACPHTYGQI